MNMPIDYHGCRNCAHQPGPMRTCEKLSKTRIEPVCSSWEKKGTHVEDLTFSPFDEKMHAIVDDMIAQMEKETLERLKSEEKVNAGDIVIFAHPSRKEDCYTLHKMFPNVHFIYSQAAEEDKIYEIVDEALKEMIMESIDD